MSPFCVALAAGGPNEGGGGLFDSGAELEPSLSRPARGRFGDEGRRLRLRLVDALHDVGVVDRDDHLDVGGLVAIDDVLSREQVGRRDGDGAELVQGEDGEPELVAALEDEHDRVALPYPGRREEVGGLVAHVLELGVGERRLGASLVAPDEGGRVGPLAGELVHDVVGEIEARGHVDAEVFDEVFVGGVLGSSQIFIQHRAPL